MSDSRKRFEAWLNADCRAHFAKLVATGETIVLPYRPSPDEIWQAAEAQAVRRCAEIADRIAVDYRAKYKGLPGADGVRRGGSYDTHDDGISDGGTLVDDAIRAEFPEAFSLAQSTEPKTSL